MPVYLPLPSAIKQGRKRFKVTPRHPHPHHTHRTDAYTATLCSKCPAVLIYGADPNYSFRQAFFSLQPELGGKKVVPFLPVPFSAHCDLTVRGSYSIQPCKTEGTRGSAEKRVVLSGGPSSPRVWSFPWPRLLGYYLPRHKTGLGLDCAILFNGGGVHGVA